MKNNFNKPTVAQKMRRGEPPQYPLITDPMEKAVKGSFNKVLNEMYVDLTKTMVQFKKQ